MSEKHGRYNVICPDMTRFRPAKPEDRKQPGDLFNVGKWEHKEDKYVKASCPNGQMLSPWESYYLVMKDRRTNGEDDKC